MTAPAPPRAALDRYATFAFRGTMVQLYLVQDPNHGISAISIDNGPETLVDLYSKTRRGYRMLWAGERALRLEPTTPSRSG